MAKAGPGAGGLEVNEDRAWQEKFWTAQRFGWIVMALFILAVIAGLTGMGGPLASARAELGGGTIKYPRITRWQADDQLEVRLEQSSAANVELTLSPQFVHTFAISSIQPEPTQVQATAAGHRFMFETEPGGGERVIAFNLRASKPVFEQTIGASLGDSRPVRLTITVLP